MDSLARAGRAVKASRPWADRLLDGGKREVVESLRLTIGEHVAFKALADRCGVPVSQILRLGGYVVLAAAEYAEPDRAEADALLDKLADLVTSPPDELSATLEPMLRAGEWAEAARAEPPVTFARFAPLSQREVA